MLVDRIQRDFECCGAAGPEDWVNSSYNRNTSGIEFGIGALGKTFNIPTSCCVPSPTDTPSSYSSCDNRVRGLRDTTEVKRLVQDQLIFGSGCLEKFENFMKDKWQWILITGAILIGVQVFALIFACVLCCAISRVGDK